MQWYGLFPSLHLSPGHPSLLTASTNSRRRTRCPSPKRKYISSVPSAFSCSATVSQGARFPSTIPSQSKSPPPDRQSTCAHQARSTRRRYSNPSPPVWTRRQCARYLMQAGPRCSPLSPSFSPPNFPTRYLGMSSAHCRRSPAQRGALAFPTPRDAFLTALAKAALSTRVVAALDELPQAQQTPRFPVSLEALTVGLTGSGGSSGSRTGAGLSPRNLVCLCALVARCDVSSWHAGLQLVRRA